MRSTLTIPRIRPGRVLWWFLVTAAIVRLSSTAEQTIASCQKGHGCDFAPLALSVGVLGAILAVVHVIAVGLRAREKNGPPCPHAELGQCPACADR